MTTMLLALVLSDAVLYASDLNDNRIVRGKQGGSSVQTLRSTTPWTPRIDSWESEDGLCPVFFQHEIEGFGTVLIRPRCREDDGLPHAL